MPRGIEVVKGKVEVIGTGSVHGSGQGVTSDQLDEDGNAPPREVTQNESEIHPLAEGLPRASRGAVQEVGVRHP